MRKLLSPLFLFLFVANIGLAQSFSEGPRNGHLIIAGGALRDISVFDKFIELAGGKGKAHVIVVPTAGGNEVTEEVIARIKKDW
ncbi:MAG: cyanophycinase, partial [Roseivirga sp.]